MAFMLCDHLWATVIPGNNWLTDIGRIAFPIFAFMTAEGFYHTKNLKKYAGRLFVFALVSEIPFNLMMGSRIFYPIHQNVLWTFLIAVGLMWMNEKVKNKRISARVLVGIGTVVLGFVLGLISFCDYHYAGVLTVLVFYFFRKRNIWSFIGQAVCLWYINFEILSGFEYVFTFFGNEIHLLRQGLALLALIPIWLYNGRQGHYSKGIRALYYWFYPAHMILLWAIREIFI